MSLTQLSPRNPRATDLVPSHWVCENQLSDGTPTMVFDEALAAARSGKMPSLAWLVPLLTASPDDAIKLYAAADEVRDATVGKDVHLRALIEFSNYCKRNCAYCGLRREIRTLERYRLTQDEIVATAKEAQELGYHSVVLQSGEDPWYTTARLVEVIERIKLETGLAITLSVGEREESAYRAWRDAGADRVLIRIETTDPVLFQALHPDDDLEERKRCILVCKRLGYQLGSGVMVGLPNQTPELLARDVLWLHEIGAEMIGVGPFIPHPQTPLKDEASGTLAQTLRLVAVLRLVFPTAHLPATTATGSLDPLGREKALAAGANVMMPNASPVETRDKYQLYPDKICLDDSARHCSECIRKRIRAIGRTVGTDQGHVWRVAKGNEATTAADPKE